MERAVSHGVSSSSSFLGNKKHNTSALLRFTHVEEDAGVLSMTAGNGKSQNETRLSAEMKFQMTENEREIGNALKDCESGEMDRRTSPCTMGYCLLTLVQCNFQCLTDDWWHNYGQNQIPNVNGKNCDVLIRCSKSRQNRNWQGSA